LYPPSNIIKDNKYTNYPRTEKWINDIYHLICGPRLNCIEQWFNQVKHYLKLYKSKDLEELKENLKKSIKNIRKERYKNYFIYAYKKKIL